MKNLKFKMILDLIMSIAWIFLMDYMFTGLLIHELLGLAIIGLFIFHNLINFDWIKNITKNIFTGKINFLTSLKYSLNLILLFMTFLVGISGVLISTNILTSISTSNRNLWVYIHRASSYGSLIFISIHIGLHWNMIMAMCRKLFNIQHKNAARTFILRLLALALVVVGIKSSFDNNILHKILPESMDKKEKSLSSNFLGVQTVYAHGGGEGKPNKGGHKIEVNFDENPPAENETLEDYLGRLTCTGCGKRCLLTNPQCGKGTMQATQAQTYYNENSLGKTPDNTSNDNTSNDNDDNDNNDKELNNDNIINDSDESLENFLGKLYCDGCGKHCSLLNPQCGIGVNKANEAKIEYNSTNNQPTQNSTTDNSTPNNTNKNDISLLFDIIPIMSLYIAGAYYTVEVVLKKRKS